MGAPAIQPKASRSIPLLDLKKLFEWNRDEYVAAMTEVASQGAFIGGTAVDRFEKDFAAWVGAGNHAAGCGNGTDAIFLAAKALRLPAGSEAIVPAMTFIATIEALIHAGLTLKLVDVRAGDWLMDPDLIESAVTEKTKLIVPVHLYGQMAQMDRIRKIADKHRCYVIEDAAQAHGAKWKGKPVGSWGHAATFSFFPGKNLGAFGDAGLVLSQNHPLVDQVSALGKHGGLRKYEHLQLGHNSRLDALHAAILRVRLKYIDRWTDLRRGVAQRYREQLTGLDGIELPFEQPDAKHVYHHFVVMCPQREALQNHLAAHGIQTGVHYPRAVHQQPALQNQAFAKQSFPNAEKMAAQGLSLPMCPTLSLEDVDFISQTIKKFR